MQNPQVTKSSRVKHQIESLLEKNRKSLLLFPLHLVSLALASLALALLALALLALNLLAFAPLTLVN